MNTFPLPPTKLVGFGPLIGGDLWDRWAERKSVFPLDSFRDAVRYMRLKPMNSCRLAVFDRNSIGSINPERGFLLHLYPNQDRARMAFTKINERPQFIGPEGYRPFLSDEYAVVAIPFPNDLELRSLRQFYRPYRLKEALYSMLPEYPVDDWRISKSATRIELLAYKPGRRAVFRVDLALHNKHKSETDHLPLHAKIECADVYGHGHTNLSAVHAALDSDACWGVPRPRGKDDAHRLVVSDWIDGSPLVSCLGDSAAADAFHNVGRGLGELHGLRRDVKPSTCPLTPERLVALGNDLAMLMPAHGSRIAKLAERLASLVSALAARSTHVMIHGDFHIGQILMCADRPFFVDLDRAGSGIGAWDVGSFLAHLREFGANEQLADAFLRGYLDTAQLRPKPTDIVACEAAALFRRSIFPFRTLATDWPEQVVSRLSLVEQLLEMGTS